MHRGTDLRVYVFQTVVLTSADATIMHVLHTYAYLNCSGDNSPGVTRTLHYTVNWKWIKRMKLDGGGDG